MTSFVAFLVRLIDVSRWQDDPDTAYKPTFEKVKEAGFKGVVVRVGWGLVIDALFAWFWKVLKGILARKPYWYLDYYSHRGTGTTDEEWGIEQAGACYDALKADPGEAPLAIDCENCPGVAPVTYLTRASYNRVLKGFIKEWKRLTGKTVDIYCSPGFMWVFDAEIRAMDLWLALYNRLYTAAQAITYARSKGWTGRVLLWQYTSDGDVNDDGIPDGKKLGMETDALDLDAWLGTEEEWSAYCGGTMVPIPPEPRVPPVIPTQKVFTVISAGGLNVRDVPIGMPGSQVIGFHPRGTVLTSLETVAIGQDVWIRVSPWSVCAVRFNNITYLG